MSDFSKFRLRVNINSTIETVYKAWATRKGLESWFLRKALFKDSSGKPISDHDFINSDATYEWYWFGYSDEVVEKGTVLKANKRNEFSFTFSLGCPVRISIFEEKDEVICELVESDLPTDEENLVRHYVGDSRGWIFYLTNLKSVLEGGLDLRNKREDIKDVITA